MTEWVENKKKVNPLLYEGKNNQIEYKAEFKTKRRFGEKKKFFIHNWTKCSGCINRAHHIGSSLAMSLQLRKNEMRGLCSKLLWAPRQHASTLLSSKSGETLSISSYAWINHRTKHYVSLCNLSHRLGNWSFVWPYYLLSMLNLKKYWHTPLIFI